MKKVAVFVEGQTELIFVRNLLFYLLSPQKFSFDCFGVRGGGDYKVPYEYPNPVAEIHFQIINVGNDQTVLQFINRRQDSLVKQGFDKIIGLRDMYSKKYRELAQQVDAKIIQQVIDETNGAIQEMPHASKIDFHFAIMETEAWWLGMYNLFAKIDARLTPQFINEKLGFDLTQLDPQITFLHPAKIINQIFHLVGLAYNKHSDDIENITKKIDDHDLLTLLESGRCASFKPFYEALTA